MGYAIKSRCCHNIRKKKRQIKKDIYIINVFVCNKYICVDIKVSRVKESAIKKLEETIFLSRVPIISEREVHT